MANGYGLEITKSGQSKVDTKTAYGAYIKEFPVGIMNEVKELYSNDWHDEDGLDEYVPDTLKMSSFDAEITFIMNDTVANVKTNLVNFRNFLIGTDGKGASYSIKDPYTGIGWSSCRLNSIDNDATLTMYDDENNTEKCLFEFKVSFKVLNPELV